MNLERLYDPSEPDPVDLYKTLVPPKLPPDRPYVYVNMASTLDGKIVVGKPGGTAAGVGGPTDQALFRRIHEAADGLLIGASTLRAGNVVYPRQKPRFVVTATGDVPLKNRFFTDDPEFAYVLAPEHLPPDRLASLAGKLQVISVGRGTVDLAAALSRIRYEHGVERLLCEGGAHLNFEMLNAGLVDELFMTLAPKIKGGTSIPTIVSGEGFPPGSYLEANLLSAYRDGDELYLRYRLNHTPHAA